MRDFLTERDTGSDALVARALARLRGGFAYPHVVPDAIPPPDASPQPTTPAPDLDRILGLTLADFGTEHLAVKVRIPGEATPHWFVSGPGEVAVLRNEGVPRGVIWTAKELAAVRDAGWTKNTVKTVIDAKRVFSAVVGEHDTPGR